MPAIGAAVAGAIGLVGTTALVAGAAIDIGLAVGASYLSSALSGKSSSDSGGLQASVQVGGDQPRGCLYGRHGTAGYLAYVNTSVDTNVVLQMVYVIGDGPHDGLDAIWVYGARRSLTKTQENDHVITYTVDGFALGGYPLITVLFWKGFSNQPASPSLANLANPSTRWGADDRLAGTCYVEVNAWYQENYFDAGIPDFFFEVRGRRCYDWRADSTNGGAGDHRWDDERTWAFSDNPMVQLHDYQRGVWRGGERTVGMGVLPVDIDLDAYTAAANACDELVAESDGSSAPRYRCGTAVADNEEHATVIQRLLDSCGGALHERVGVYSPHAGVAQVVTYPTITDGDLVAGYEVRLAAKRPRSDLVNGVFGSYSEPSEKYELVAYAARTDAGAETADGEIIRTQADFPSVHHALQAQRLAKLQLDLARLQGTATLTLGLRAVVLEPGDWVRWDSARYGDHKWLITGLTQNADQTVTLSLRQISGSAYGWSEDDELDGGFGGEGGDKPALLTTIPLMDAAPTLIAGDDGTRQPAIRVTWTPILDGTADLITLEYRVVSAPDAVLEASTSAVSNGSYVIGGLQGATGYEVRGTLSGRPARDTTWTNWLPVTTGDATAVPNGSITLEQFSAALRAQIEAVDAAAVAQLQQDVGEIQSAVPDLQAAVDAAQAAADAAAAEAGTAASAAQSAAAEATGRAAQAASELRDQVRQLSTAVAEAGAGAYADLVTIRDGLVQRMQVLQISLGEAAASIATLQTAMVSADEALATQIEAVSASLATTSASVATVQQALATLDNATASSILGLQASLDGVEANIAGAQTAIADLQAGKAEASTVEGLAATVGDHAARIATLDEAMSDLEGSTATSVAGLTATVGSQGTAISGLETEVSALQAGKAAASTVESLAATVGGHTAQISTLDQAVSDLEADKAEASTVTALQTAVAGKASQASVDNLSSAVSTLDTSTASQITALQSQVDDVAAGVNVTAVTTTKPSGAASAWSLQVTVDAAGRVSSGGMTIGVFGTQAAGYSSRIYVQADAFYVMNGTATSAIFTVNSEGVFLRGNLIADGSITAAKIFTHTITADEISIGGVTTTSLATNAVTELVTANVAAKVFSLSGSGNVLTASISRTSGCDATITIDFSETYTARTPSYTAALSVLFLELRRTNGGDTTTLKQVGVQDSPYAGGLSVMNTYGGNTYSSQFCTFTYVDTDNISGTTTYTLYAYGSQGVVLFNVNLSIIEYKR